MHLLVLDDERGMSQFIAFVARDRSWIVETTTSETEFRGLYQARRPDAVMLDLQLGTADGVEQLRFLSDDRYSGSVVLISGFDARVLASAQQLGESLGLFVAAALTKPVRRARLVEVLEVIERRLPPKAADATAANTMPPLHKPAAMSFQAGAVAEAIRGGQMELHLQPILSAADLAIMRLEALIRWRHPELGMIPPDSFIPVAEREEAVIDQLTMWVIETAIEQYRRLAALGIVVPISVNVSGVNLHTLDFPDRVVALVEKAGIPFSGLAFEVTESVAMRRASEVTDILTRLRLKGFALAMDDFGTGYSSLKALRQMPFSEIKIDRSFISDVLTSRDSYAIVKSVIALARVETGEIAALLADLGATGLQGYLYSRALPLSEITKWIQDHVRARLAGVPAHNTIVPSLGTPSTSRQVR